MQIPTTLGRERFVVRFPRGKRFASQEMEDAIARHSPDGTGRYEIGSGSFGVVLLGWDEDLHVPVAVKLLKAQSGASRADVSAFKNEARHVARLSQKSSSIVSIYACSVEEIGHDSVVWLAMEYLSNGSLADRIRQGPLTPEGVLGYLSGISSALDLAHRSGTVHRDVKPQNMLFDDAGWLHLCDFGLAKGADQTVVIGRSNACGTPAYMAPEIWDLANVDKVDFKRCDQYALGVIAYEMLTGGHPAGAAARGWTLEEWCQWHQRGKMAPPADALPADSPFFEAIAKATARRPEERFETCRDFVAAMKRAQIGPSEASLHDLRSLLAGLQKSIEKLPAQLLEPFSAAFEQRDQLRKQLAASHSDTAKLSDDKNRIEHRLVSVEAQHAVDLGRVKKQRNWWAAVALALAVVSLIALVAK